VMVDEVSNINWREIGGDKTPTLVLFRDVKDATRARAMGLPNGILNVGNVHAGPGRVSITRSVFLNEGETEALHSLQSVGMQIVIQSIPSEKPSSLPS
jgi:mannose/fructose/N-acetylgalactosamine-specific phosphotransferase system component IIB